MLPYRCSGSGSQTFVLLHFFAGSQAEWTEVQSDLSNDFRCVTMDLPGFGSAAVIKGYSVDDMARHVAETIDSLSLKEFILVGHSMSGKLSMKLAIEGLKGIVGLILIGSSPLSPEPMEEKDRKTLLGFKRIRKDAEIYLDRITAHPLTEQIRERAIQDFIRSSPDAWTAWLEKGSREDWSSIGKVAQPTIVIAGTKDPSLSGSVQRKLTLPSLINGRIEEIPDCGHLPMMETPTTLSKSMRKFATNL